MTRNTILAALALLLPSVAWADPKDDARRHFAEGLKAAQRGDYEVALQRFLSAQDAYPHPATLYNIARAYADMDDLSNALQYYRLYRDAEPQKAPEVDPIIQVLEARIGNTMTVTGPVASTGGGGGGAGMPAVVLAGATEEELARLDAISAELEALQMALQNRAESSSGMVVGTSPGTGGGVPITTPGGGPVMPTGPMVGETGEGGEVDMPAMPDSGFIAEAYEKLVVTASRVGQDPLDSPSTLTVVTGEDIRLSGATTFEDALRRVVGMDVMEMVHGNSYVSIRGFNRELSNKVLILIDGRSTYLEVLGTTFWHMMPIALEDVDRIEIIRGPGSAVYGANAVTGVINIITKTPGETEETIFKVEGGNPGYRRAVATTSGRRGTTAYRMTARYQNNGRYQKEYDLYNDDGTLKEGQAVSTNLPSDDQASRVVAFNGRLDKTYGSKAYLSVQGGYGSGDSEFANIGALGRYINANQESGTLRGDASYDILHLRAFWNRDSGIALPAYTSAGNTKLDVPYKTDQVDIELEAPVEFETGAAKHVLNLGLGYRYVSINFGFLEGGIGETYSQNHFKGFLNEELTIGKFKAVGSLRIDKHPLLKVGDTISPRIAMIYRLFDKTSVRGTFGSAFRQPMSVESYLGFPLPTTADGAFIYDRGSLNLAPEQITTFELGIHDESTYYHTADVAVYYNQVQDLIELVSVNREVNPFDYDIGGIQAGSSGFANADRTYRGYGVEAEAEFYPVDGLDVFANGSFQRLEEVAPNGDVTRDASTPLLKGNFGAAYRTDYRTDISASLHYNGPQTWRIREFDAAGQLVVNEYPLPRRLLANARVAVRPFRDEAMELSATVWNLGSFFNANGGYREHPLGQAIGPKYFGSLTYKF